MSTEHAKAAARFIANREQAQWHNETLWLVRRKRDALAGQMPEWEELRTLAHEIKMHTLSHLEEYLVQFSDKAESNGITVHWAKDAEEHNRIISGILQSRQVKKLVKSKSMLTEECHLNAYLREQGIEVIESDLGERILQLMDQPPSHIVMPAIHLKREEVGKLFEEKMQTEKGNSDPTYLTRSARYALRKEFLSAGAALTGANFGVAETGDIVVCTNEGNADMGTSIAPLHIVSMGMEKLVPNLESLGVFTRLLARSATGQPSTTYTSHYRKPGEGCETHLVIVDNGRSRILGTPAHTQLLKCIRCGACMNTCPVYRRSGGYSYSYFIPGPIGINLGMARDPVAYSGNTPACSLCYSCNNVCPVQIDLADQIYAWRQGLSGYGTANPVKRGMSAAMQFIFKRPSLFKAALRIAPLLNIAPRFLKYNGLNAWGKGRELPHFAKESFARQWEKGKVTTSKKSHEHPH